MLKGTEFNATHHINFIEEVFRMFDFDRSLKDWAICQLADSAAVNIKIAKDMGHNKHISCKNHSFPFAQDFMIYFSINYGHNTLGIR